MTTVALTFHGKSPTDMTDQELIEARDELSYIGDYAVGRKSQWRDGSIKVKPPRDVNPHFSALKVAIEKEIKDRGI